jgi:hypothetical protein
VNNIKRIGISLLMLVMSVMSVFQSAAALFEESVKITGTSFTIGTSSGGGGDPVVTNTSLKLYSNLSGTPVDTNLKYTLAGPVFDNIDPLWTSSIPLKVYNKGQEPLTLISKVDYINDPDVLRDDIYVNVLSWNDIDNDGVIDQGEEGTSFGYDTLLRWRNDTFQLGTINAGETKSYIFKFDGTGLTSTNVGMSAVYDFVITGTGQ